MTYLEEAQREVEHVDDVANRDHWSGDRESYMARHLARAQVLATIAVAEELHALVAATYTAGGV